MAGRPTEEIVDEFVRRQPGEPENVYQFRRWIAQTYVKHVKANPEAFLAAGQEYVAEMGLRVLRLTAGGIHELRHVPVWGGLVPVQSMVSSFGGLGPYAIQRTT